jgi:phosphatidylglycerophosphate synthase
MQKEISIRTPPPQEHVPHEVAGDDSLVSTQSSRFERGIIEWLCQPLLPRIPASVHPNTISLATHFVAWLAFGLALASPHLPPAQRAMALVGAGLGTLLSMIGDCLDGMHARSTNQCSKLGELMDHWLDALIVPMVTVGISMALEMPPWAILAVNITAAMVYHGQLVLYHHTGKFLQPDAATGVEAQFGVSLGYFALAVLFYFVDRHQPWLDVAMAAVAVIGLIVQMRCNFFYYARLGRLIDRHLIFVSMCCGFAALHLMSAIDIYAFVMSIIFVSFRICGTYVLSSVVGRRYDGGDLGIVLWIAIIAATHYFIPGVMVGSVTLLAALPACACLYMLGRNLLDFAREYPKLRPSAASL